MLLTVETLEDAPQSSSVAAVAVQKRLADVTLPIQELDSSGKGGSSTKGSMEVSFMAIQVRLVSMPLWS